MPKTLSADYKAAAESGCKIALCVDITLKAGAVIRFTSWSDWLTVSANAYDPSELVKIEAMDAATGTEVQTLKFSGLLGNFVQVLGTVLTQDMLRFFWKDAKVTFFKAIPDLLGRLGHSDTEAIEHVASGDLGTITIDNETQFTAEFLSKMKKAAINASYTQDLSCAFSFCVKGANGFGCHKDVATVQHTVSVSTVSGDGLTLTATVTPGVTFERGWGRCTSGANLGFDDVQFKSHSQAGGVATIVLYDAFPFPIAPGQAMVWTEGCRKDVADCTAHGQILYNGSFPDVPGVDQLSSVGT